MISAPTLLSSGNLVYINTENVRILLRFDGVLDFMGGILYNNLRFS